MFEALRDPDLESLLLDSTTIRAHQHAAGTGKKTEEGDASGRSRGGLRTKIHVAVDAQGQPMELQLGPGQEHDVLRGESLLASHEPHYVIADKGYDSDALIEVIAEHGAQVVIPPRSNRHEKRRYKPRNLVERFFNRIKHYRRIATRYEKTARNYLTFVNLTATLVSLGMTVNTT